MVVFKDKNDIINVLRDGKKTTINSINELNVNDNDFIITCDQLFTTRAKQYDVCVIEKMIFFPGPKNLRRLYLKYTHKDIDLNSIANVLKAIETVYKKQQELVNKNKLQKAVSFHSVLSGFISFVNQGKNINLNDFFINSLEEKKNKVDKNKNLSRSELINYMTQKRYDFYDVNTGSFKLNHDFMLSLNDDFLNEYIRNEKNKGQYNAVKNYNKSNKINHTMWGTITGRITTSEPNIQGLKLNTIEPSYSLYSFDFTGFEIIIYLSLYNKSLLSEFIESGKNDVFSFLFYKIYPSKYKFDSDLLKEKEPETRQKFKMLTLRTLYGATKEDVAYWYGDGVVKLYNTLNVLLSKNKSVDYLLNYCQKTGRYLINDYINLSIQDRSSFNVHNLHSEYKNFKKHKGDYSLQNGRDLYTKERGIVIEWEDSFSKVKKLCLNYNIQGTGAVIIKQALIDIIKSQIKSQILILRHDEVIVDIKELSDINKIELALKKAAIDVIGVDINIKTNKI